MNKSHLSYDHSIDSCFFEHLLHIDITVNYEFRSQRIAVRHGPTTQISLTTPSLPKQISPAKITNCRFICQLKRLAHTFQEGFIGNFQREDQIKFGTSFGTLLCNKTH